MDPDDYQEMEERLYAQIHHDTQAKNGENDRQFQHAPRFSHNNNRSENQNRGRYWASHDDNFQPQRRVYNQFENRRQQNQQQGRIRYGQNQHQQIRHDSPRNFLQRGSRFSNINMFRGNNDDGPNNRKQFEKRNQSNNFPVMKKKGPIRGVNPFNVANQERVRLENKIRVLEKRKKALTRQQTKDNQTNFKVPQLPTTSRASLQGNQSSKNVANKEKGKQKKKITPPLSPVKNTKIIFVDNDHESDNESVELEKDIDFNASQDDDVIMIPTPAPEIVSILDSDEETEELNKAQNAQKEPGSRCVSPSNSSILSDDFIGQNDRTRLQSEFLFDLPVDKDVQADQSSTEDSDHSSEQGNTSIIDTPIPGPSTVGNLGEFILKGAAVENSLLDASNTEKEKETSGEHNTDDDDDDDESEENNALNNKASTDPIDITDETKDDDDVILLSPTTETQTNKGRKRTISNRSSDCDIMLNLSSKNRSDPRISSSDPQEDDDTDNVEIVETHNDEPITIDDDNQSEKLDPELGWNDEMKRFYYESWGGEQFNLKRILSGMCPDRKNWEISVNDRYPPASIKLRNRCRNCQEFSHKVQNCPLPKRRIVCHMCGEEGHREPRCPNSLCLSCGSPQRQYMRYCRKCLDSRKKRCSLCNMRGHIFALCPDKWRRYHSTIEDHVPLNETYVPNKKIYCSVCSSSKHQAHNCLQAETEMGRFLPCVKIVSYLPWYNIDVNRVKVKNDTEFSMMSYHKDFSFNWSPETTENPHGFYNRFKEITGLMQEEIEKEVQRELESVRNERPEAEEENEEEVEEIPMEEEEHPESTSDTSILDTTDRLNNFSFTKEMEKIEGNQRNTFHLDLEDGQRIETVEPVIFEDHRKEIDEMAERIGVTKEEIMSVRSVKFPIEQEDDDPLKEMDFIPLESSNDDKEEPQPGPSNAHSLDVIHVPEEKTDAKVFLTKENSKYLLNEGEAFLHKASQKYDLQLRVVWESIGNMLQMHGLPSNQDRFYNELLEFLRNVSLEEHIKARNNAFSMPKVKDKLLKFIEEHLSRLKTDKKSLTHLRDLIRKLNNHEKNQQHKSADKVRRQLNTFLLGKNGLRDGKMHLIGIIKQYQSLKEDEPCSETPEFRDTLRQHFIYLFTAYDHENYEGLLNDYEECVQKGKWPIPLKALFNLGNMIKLANGETFGRGDNQIMSSQDSKNSSQDDNSLFFSDNIGDRSTLTIDISDENQGDVSMVSEISQDVTSNTNQIPETELTEGNIDENVTKFDVTKSPQNLETPEDVNPVPKTPERASRGSFSKETPTTSQSKGARESLGNSPMKTPKETSMQQQSKTPKETVVSQKSSKEAPKTPAMTPKMPKDAQVTPKTPAKGLKEDVSKPSKLSNTSTPLPKTPKQAISSKITPLTPSNAPINYSQECLKIINDAISMFSIMNNQRAILKLKRVEKKANNNELGEEDFQSLKQIHEIVQGKLKNISGAPKVKDSSS